METCPTHGRLPEGETWCPLCPDPPAVCHECAGPVEGKTSYPGDLTVHICARCHEAAGEQRCDWCGEWGKDVTGAPGECYHPACSEEASRGSR